MTLNNWDCVSSDWRNCWIRINHFLAGLHVNHHLLHSLLYRSGSNRRRLQRHRFVGSHSNTTNLRYYQLLNSFPFLANLNLLMMIFIVKPPRNHKFPGPTSGQRVRNQQLFRLLAQLPKLEALLHELSTGLTYELGQFITADRHQRDTTQDLHLPHHIHVHQSVLFTQT